MWPFCISQTWLLTNTHNLTLAHCINTPSAHTYIQNKCPIIAYSVNCSHSYLWAHHTCMGTNLALHISCHLWAPPTFVKNSRSTPHKYHHGAYAAICSPQQHYTQRHTCILTTYSFYHAYPSPPTIHTSCYHCLPTLTIIHIITTHHFNMQIHAALPSL